MSNRNLKSAKGGDISFKWDEKESGFRAKGHFFNVEHNKGSKGTSTIYTLKQENGENISFWGSAVLDDQFAGKAMGIYVEVEYQGKKVSKRSGSQYHAFELFYDDNDVMDMSANSSDVNDSPVENTAPMQADAEDDDDVPF